MSLEGHSVHNFSVFLYSTPMKMTATSLLTTMTPLHAKHRQGTPRPSSRVSLSFLYLTIYLPIYLSIYLTIFLSIYRSMYLSIHLPIYLSTSIDLPFYLSISLSLCLLAYAYLPIYPST